MGVVLLACCSVRHDRSSSRPIAGSLHPLPGSVASEAVQKEAPKRRPLLPLCSALPQKEGLRGLYAGILPEYYKVRRGKGQCAKHIAQHISQQEHGQRPRGMLLPPLWESLLGCSSNRAAAPELKLMCAWLPPHSCTAGHPRGGHRFHDVRAG